MNEPTYKIHTVLCVRHSFFYVVYTSNIITIKELRHINNIDNWVTIDVMYHII